MAGRVHMSDEKRVNGHRPKGLLPLAFAAALSSGSSFADDLDFDVDAVLAGVVRLHAEIPADGYTAPMLGIEREGHGIVLDDAGLVLTIGYLIMEAMAISVENADGRMVPAAIVASDYGTGAGPARAGSLPASRRSRRDSRTRAGRREASSPGPG